MGRLFLFFLFIVIITCSCQNRQLSSGVLVDKTDGQKFAEAYKEGDWETVISIGDTLIDDSDKMNLSIGYAEALAAVGNTQKALDVLNRKLQKEPDNYYVYQTKGNIYYMLSQHDLAIINFEKVVALRPRYARPYMYLGEIYEIIGCKEQAIKYYLVATRLFAENGLVKEAMEYGNRVLALDSTNVEVKELISKGVR